MKMFKSIALGLVVGVTISTMIGGYWIPVGCGVLCAAVIL